MSTATPPAIEDRLIRQLERLDKPQDLLREILERFGTRAAIGTSGQLSGVVMIAMAVQAGIKPRVFTIDTLRLFDETYELFDELEKRYEIHIERMTPDAEKLAKMISRHGEYLFFDSKEKQEYCCHLRKVEPNERALNTLDVWISGLRRDQSTFRADTKRFEIIRHGPENRPILKVSPLVDWTEEELRKYTLENDVPIHKLLKWEEGGWRYESLGCKICTTPIGPDEPRRSGRWRWFKDKEESDNKECGLHTSHKES